jgi:hypothetical protein
MAFDANQTQEAYAAVMIPLVMNVTRLAAYSELGPVKTIIDLQRINRDAAQLP